MLPDHREPLLQALKEYEGRWSAERELVARYRTFVLSNPNCFERSLLEGHVTGSALVTNHDFSKVLLTHHKKLNKWLQLGGHSDGHPLAHETALREAEEESGLENLKLFSEGIFDLDIHEIPERKSEPTHLHYDARFIVVASNTNFRVSEESNDLKWFTLSEAHKASQEESMHRQFRKLKLL